MKRLFVIPFLALLLAFGLQFDNTQALVRDGAVWTTDCAGFASQGGGFVADRDNTGQGRERFTITATDGVGNVIFGPVSESIFVGSRLTFPEGMRFNWAQRPIANPLTVRVVSPAGNGVPEQAVYTVRGICPGITTAAPLLSQPVISAAISDPDAANLQPGSILVNTFRLNVRSGDGLQYSVIGQLNGGQEAAVLGVNAARTWWYIQAGDLRGWVSGSEDFIAFRGDLSNTPIVQARGDVAPPRFLLYIRNPIYDAPRLDANRLCEVRGNTEYVIEFQNPSGAWFGIRAECDGQPVVGWILEEWGALRNPSEMAIPVAP